MFLFFVIFQEDKQLKRKQQKEDSSLSERDEARKSREDLDGDEMHTSQMHHHSYHPHYRSFQVSKFIENTLCVDLMHFLTTILLFGEYNNSRCKVYSTYTRCVRISSVL